MREKTSCVNNVGDWAMWYPNAITRRHTQFPLLHCRSFHELANQQRSRSDVQDNKEEVCHSPGEISNLNPISMRWSVPFNQAQTQATAPPPANQVLRQAPPPNVPEPEDQQVRNA